MRLGWLTVDCLVLSAVLLIPVLSGCSPSDPVAVVGSAPNDEAYAGPPVLDIDWSNLYGPQQDSSSRESDIELNWSSAGPTERWRRSTGLGFSAPICVDGKVTVLSRKDDQEVVDCLQAASGEPIWQHEYPTTFENAFDYSNGPYSTPVANDQHVFTIGAQGQVHCFELTSGTVIWNRDLFDDYEIKKRDWPFAGSPLLLEDKLIINVGASEKSAGIIAISLADGKTLWESTDDGYAHTTPVKARIHDRDFLFVLTFEGLVCLDPVDGAVHWEIAHQVNDPTGMNGTNAVSPIVVVDRVCIVAGPKTRPGMRCLRILPDGSYDEPWSDFKVLKSQYTNLISLGDRVFGFTPMTVGGPTLKCINVGTGKIQWKGKPGVGRGNMLRVGAQVIVLGEDGTIVSFDATANQYVELARTQAPVLEKPCYTSMALSNGLLFARNEKEIVCLDLRPNRADELSSVSMAAK